MIPRGDEIRPHGIIKIRSTEEDLHAHQDAPQTYIRSPGTLRWHPQQIQANPPGGLVHIRMGYRSDESDDWRLERIPKRIKQI